MSPIRNIATAVLVTAVRLPKGLAMVALMLLMAMTFLDILLRSTVNAPIEASTELSRILLMFVVFAAMPEVTLRGTHVAVDLLAPVLDRVGFARIEGLILIGSAMLMYWPDQKILTLAMRSKSYGDMTEFLHIPTYLPALCVFAFMVMTTVCFAIAGLWLLLTGYSFGFERREAKEW